MNFYVINSVWIIIRYVLVIRQYTTSTPVDNLWTRAFGMWSMTYANLKAI